MRKKLIITIVILAVIVAGLWSILGWYKGEQQADLLRQAQVDYEAGHRDWMIDRLREALALAPNNLEALATQARLLDAVDDPACLNAYRRLSELQPADQEALTAWLAALVRYERTSEAIEVYEQMAGGKSPLAPTAGFSRLGANLAGSAGDTAAQLRYLREAYQRDPEDVETGLGLSLAEAQSLPVAELAPTQARLAKLLDRPEVRTQAAALLLAIEAQAGDQAALQASAEHIWELGYDDVELRLLALDAFYQIDRELFEKKLALLLDREQRDNESLTAIFDWLLAHEEYDTIIRMATEEGASMGNLKRPPVANRVVEAMILTDQLKALRRYNAGVAWTGAEGFASLLPPLVSTLDREKARDFPNPSFTRWLAVATLPQLREILPVTERLDFPAERAAILQEIIRDDPWDREAYRQLYAMRSAERDSLGMLKLLQEERANFPQDREIADEYAWITLVLNVDRRGSEQIAKLNFSSDPTDPEFRVTWALAQCLSKDPTAALKTLEPLKEPGVRARLVKALAYRLLDDKAASDEVLAGEDMANLLPDERRLVLESRPLPKDD
ncbi:hypothetical protein H5P28_08850 [Ruficoccus amylovorans]|uniref:Tetratricopeptide repeat protein n=1 Tax=Ruficoccus amylovorans TaxID=1804625 RepID=A0A842HD00_9BACT|nr:hypothetical protein [Ruficoccus amylovorans]MBC2594363.1 hypothetical protein [Ruficoccus amylovorans]